MIKKSELEKNQNAIKELVKKQLVYDQEMLIRLLKKHYGIELNQSAVSRYLRTLGIYKRMRGESVAYELPGVDVVVEMLHYATKSAHCNETMIVVKTVAGAAGMVSEFIDTQMDLEILGTIAGENTVLVIPISVKSIDKLFGALCQKLKIKEYV